MTQPSKDDRVKVEYIGKLLRYSDDSRTVGVQDDYGLFHCYDKETVTLTVLDPDNWPPVVGDVWKAGEKHYHYIGDLNPKFWSSNARGYEYVSGDYLRSRKPVLVFREGQK